MANIIKDSYTGYRWCGKALHLLTPENRSLRGGCLPCQRLNAEKRRAERGRTRPYRPRERPAS